MSVLDSKKVRECIGKVTVVSIDGYQRIENGAFIGSSVHSINIGKSIESIGDHAFKDVSSLTEVTFHSESKIKRIGKGAFQNTGLKTIELPESLLSLESDAFLGCSNINMAPLLVNSSSSTHTISGSGELTQEMVTNNIGDGSSAVDVIITGFTSIGNYAFSYKDLSGTVTIPASVTTIGVKAFYDCGYPSYGFKYPIFESGSQLKTIGLEAFHGSTIQNITLPASLTSIGNEAFRSCVFFKSVIFESGSHLETIGDRAFYLSMNYISVGWTALSITLPSSLKTIGDDAFRRCTRLTSVTIDSGSQLETIGVNAFLDSGLSTFAAPQNVMNRLGLEVGTGKTVRGKGGVTVTLYGDITNPVINSTSVVDTINDGQTALGSVPLGSVSANEPVTWSIAAGTGVSIATDGTLSLDAVTSHSFTVKAEDESGNVSTKDLVVNVNATIAETCCSTSPVTITVSSEFVDGASTYKYTTSDTNGNGGLYGCITASRGSTLTIYAVGEYVELVSHPIIITGYNDQGQQMGQLTGVVRTETGGQNNTGTYTLTWVVPADEGVDKYQYQCETHAHMRGTINVTGSAPAPATSVGDLNGDGTVNVADLIWLQKHLNRIAGFELSGTDFDNTTAPAPAPTSATISGTGELTSTKVQQEIGDGTGVENVVISGFTSIGSSAFSTSNISGSVTIPSTITSIGTYAFTMCHNVTSVIFESGSTLETIGSSAFREIGASSITIPASVKSIESSVFSFCSNLSSVEFESGSNLSSIGDYAFQGSALSNFAIPDKVTTIGNYAFRQCASLTSLTLGGGSLLTSIGDSTFAESGLTTFSAPQGVLDNLGLSVGSRNVGGAANVSVF